MEVPAVETATAPSPDETAGISWRSRLRQLAKINNRPIQWATAAIVAAMFIFYALQLYRVGMDLREGVWVYARHDRYSGDIDTAMAHAAEVLNTAEEMNGPLLR